MLRLANQNKIYDFSHNDEQPRQKRGKKNRETSASEPKIAKLAIGVEISIVPFYELAIFVMNCMAERSSVATSLVVTG